MEGPIPLSSLLALSPPSPRPPLSSLQSTAMAASVRAHKSCHRAKSQAGASWQPRTAHLCPHPQIAPGRKLELHGSRARDSPQIAHQPRPARLCPRPQIAPEIRPKSPTSCAPTAPFHPWQPLPQPPSLAAAFPPLLPLLSPKSRILAPGNSISQITLPSMAAAMDLPRIAHNPGRDIRGTPCQESRPPHPPNTVSRNPSREELQTLPPSARIRLTFPARWSRTRAATSW
jgi:hypothetical protein